VAINAVKGISAPQGDGPIKGTAKYIGGNSLLAGGAAGGAALFDNYWATKALKGIDATDAGLKKIDPALLGGIERARNILAKGLNKSKLRNPLMAGAGALLLPLILKKIDQGMSS
jgi:hypothetical protein